VSGRRRLGSARKRSIAAVETSGRTQELSFEVTKGGEAVSDLEEYLGALGHVVVLREGSLDFLHAHPLEGASAQTGRVAQPTMPMGMPMDHGQHGGGTDGGVPLR
jgi:hypothetical protein